MPGRMICSFLLISATAASAQEVPSEASLRAADAEQLRIIVDRDWVAQQQFMHDNYMLTSPLNQVLRKPQVVAMLRNGLIANERFERHIESAAVTGDVGVVMGRETVVPAKGSEVNAAYGQRLLNRRFTNVYIMENGRWRFLARQATIIEESGPKPR